MTDHKWASHVNALCWVHDCISVLDYGCGDGALAQRICLSYRQRTVAEYDPAIPGKDARPAPADLVCCLDVLEHVKELDTVLADLKALTKKKLLVSVAASQQTCAWWRGRMSNAGFTVGASPSLLPSPEWVAVCTTC